MNERETEFGLTTEMSHPNGKSWRMAFSISSPDRVIYTFLTLMKRRKKKDICVALAWWLMCEKEEGKDGAYLFAMVSRATAHIVSRNAWPLVNSSVRGRAQKSSSYRAEQVTMS